MGCHALLQGIFLGIEVGSPSLQRDSLPSEPPRKPSELAVILKLLYILLKSACISLIAHHTHIPIPLNLTVAIWGSKITADGDCSHEIKTCLLLGRKAMTKLDSILKSRDITLSTKVHLVKAMVFSRGHVWM